MSDQRIKWVRQTRDLVVAYNQKEEMLGRLEYSRLGAFMHWLWYQEQDVFMSPGCLEEVRQKQKELKREEKKNG